MLTSRLRTRRAATAVALALVSGTAVGACGSAEDEAAPEPAPAISIGSDLSMSTGGDEPAPSASVSEECLELQGVWAATNRALVDLDEEHPRLLVAGFREADRAISSVDAPDDVPGWDGMTAYLSQAAGAFEDVDADDASAVASALTLTFSEADTARAATAHGEVTEYLGAGCR